MTEFAGPAMPCHIPDDVTLVQFILDEPHVVRPIRPQSSPWFIEDATGRKVGYEEIRMRVHGLANALSNDYGIGEDNVVCIFCPNHVDYPTAIWAVHRLGAVASCANPAYTAPELAYQLSASQSTLVLAHAAFADTARAAAREAGLHPDRLVLFDGAPGSGARTLEELIARGLRAERTYVERRLRPGEGKTKIAFLSFSSGTTGKPKAVAIPHYAPIANVLQMTVHTGVVVDPTQDRITPGDVGLAVLPFFHIYGLVVNLHFMLFCGTSLVVIPKFNFEKMLQSIVRYQIAHLFIVPPQAVLLCKHPATKKYDLRHIKFVMSGAAPLSAELVERLVTILPNADITQGYGLTETCTTLAFPPPKVKIAPLGSAGRLMPGVIARVVKLDGELAGLRERGELVVRGPSMAIGYANDAKATAETFVDGWVKTGDEVYIDELNDVYVVDRIKELIKVRGFQVAPAELEGHILTHPDVVDTCVVGIHDEFSGEVPLAFIALNVDARKRVARDAGEATRIMASVAKHVADHKVAYKKLAGGVEIVDVIPKNPSGKLLRRVLRDQARAMRAKAPKEKAKL